MPVSEGVRSTIELDRCKLSYMRAGAGAPLLYLHGSSSLPGWLPFLSQLAQRYDVIAPDHPGFGQSDIPEWFDNVHDLAYFYLDFLRALDLRGIHLVGHSLGGWIACEIAVRQTARLRTLTLVSSAGIRLQGTRKADPFLMSPETMIRSLYHDQRVADERLAQTPTEGQTETMFKDRYSFARAAWQPRLYDPHLAKWLHRIDRPTLIVWGDDDRVIPTPYAAEFARLISGAKTAIIAECGHLPMVERADRFTEIVHTFIEGSTP